MGCSGIRTEAIGEEADGGNRGDEPGATTPGGTETPSGSSRDGGSSVVTPPKVLGSYDDEQKALEALRFPGPLTAQGSRGVCTKTHFVWRDGDGALHSWNGLTKAKTDYAFTTLYRPFWQPSDTYLPIDENNNVGVYAIGAPSSPVANIEYAFQFAASDDGIIRFDGRIGTTQLAGRKVRRWKPGPAGGTVEDISNELDTQQPPMSFENDEAVIPSSVNTPFALYIVNVAKKSTASVTFDGGLSIRQTHATPHGLFVSYARSGPTSALRLYKNNQNATRVEIGDELANRPNVFKDTTQVEHAFLTKVAVHENIVFYDSAIGIWAYDLITTALTPVQLGVNKTVMVPDTLCVLPKAGLLVYRINGDPVGQVWAVPITSVVPPT